MLTRTARELLDDGARRIETDLKDQPEVQSEVARLIAATYQQLGEYDQALGLLRAELERRRRDGPRSVAAAESMTQLADVYYDQGRYTEARPLYEEALAIQREARRRTHARGRRAALGPGRYQAQPRRSCRSGGRRPGSAADLRRHEGRRLEGSGVGAREPRHHLRPSRAGPRRPRPCRLPWRPGGKPTTVSITRRPSTPATTSPPTCCASARSARRRGSKRTSWSGSGACWGRGTTASRPGYACSPAPGTMRATPRRPGRSSPKRCRSTASASAPATSRSRSISPGRP